jgi:hypothetical protein
MLPVTWLERGRKHASWKDEVGRLKDESELCALLFSGSSGSRVPRLIEARPRGCKHSSDLAIRFPREAHKFLENKGTATEKREGGGGLGEGTGASGPAPSSEHPGQVRKIRMNRFWVAFARETTKRNARAEEMDHSKPVVQKAFRHSPPIVKYAERFEATGNKPATLVATSLCRKMTYNTRNGGGGNCTRRRRSASRFATCYLRRAWVPVVAPWLR